MEITLNSGIIIKYQKILRIRPLINRDPVRLKASANFNRDDRNIIKNTTYALSHNCHFPLFIETYNGGIIRDIVEYHPDALSLAEREYELLWKSK